MERYRCTYGRCLHEWEDKPGMYACPACGHMYVEWLTREGSADHTKVYERFKTHKTVKADSPRCHQPCCTP